MRTRSGPETTPANRDVTRSILLCCVLAWHGLGCGDEVTRTQAVTIVPTDLLVRSQEEMELLAGVVEVQGRLTIGPCYEDARIYDLGPLRDLETVGELAILGCSDLQSLEGLSSLSSAGAVRLERLEIQDLRGFRSLRNVFRSFDLHDCPNLHGLDGLDALERVGDRLWVSSCGKLVSLGGLSHLRSVGDLRIGFFPLLRSLEGLASLEVAEVIGIHNCGSLGSLAGAPMLANVGAFDLSDLPALTSLSGLESVTSPTGLFLRDVPILTSLAGLQAPVRHLDISESPLTHLSGLTFADSMERVAFTDNDQLQDLSSLSGVGWVGGLVVRRCPALTSLSAFSTTRIHEEVTLTSNPGLHDLRGLEATTALGSLTVLSNEALESLLGLGNLAQVSRVAIGDNGSLCGSAVAAWIDSVTVDSWTNRGNAQCIR